MTSPESARLPSNYLCLLPHFAVPSLVSSMCIFPSIISSWRQFLHKMRPIQLAFFILLYAGCSFPPWILVIIHNFSHNQYNCSSPSSYSTTFQNFRGNHYKHIQNIKASFNQFLWPSRWDLCASDLEEQTDSTRIFLLPSTVLENFTWSHRWLRDDTLSASVSLLNTQTKLILVSECYITLTSSDFTIYQIFKAS